MTRQGCKYRSKYQINIFNTPGICWFFSGIGYFKGRWCLTIPDTPTHVVYVQQEHFSKKLDKLQRQQIIIPIGMDKTAKWYNSFVIVSTPNGIVWLSLDPVRLNQPLIRPMHRSHIVNDMFRVLIHMWYLALIDDRWIIININ